MHRDLLDLHGAYIGQKDDIKADVPPGEIRALLTSEICHLIYHALSRGTCRIAVNGHAEAMQGYIIYAYDDIRPELEKVMPGVVWKTWESRDESLRKSGVIQKTAERITQYLSGLSPEVVKVSSRRVNSDLNCGDMPKTWKHAVHEASKRTRDGASRDRVSLGRYVLLRMRRLKQRSDQPPREKDQGPIEKKVALELWSVSGLRNQSLTQEASDAAPVAAKIGS